MKLKKLNADNKAVMAGPHKVIIDLGKTEHIKGLRIKGPETNKTATYKIKNSQGVDINVTPGKGYHAPHSVYASFLKEGELTEEFKKGFCNNDEYKAAQEKHIAASGKTIADYYGEDMKGWWDIKLSKEYNARYLVIHFFKGWDNEGTGPAASVMKVAELDIY